MQKFSGIQLYVRKNPAMEDPFNYAPSTLQYTGGTEVLLETLRAYASGGAIFDWTVTSTRTYHMPAGQSKLLDIDPSVLLSPMQDDTLQYTCHTLSPLGSVTRVSFQENTPSIDVPLTGRGQKQDTWIKTCA